MVATQLGDVPQFTETQLNEIRKVRESRAKFAERLLSVGGGPYSLKKFPYARQIYKDKSEFIILFLARSLSKSTIAVNCAAHFLVTNANKSVLATAPTDAQAGRLTKEIFRPSIMYSPGGILRPMITDSDGSDQVGEIDLINNSKWTAKGAWHTGNTLRGPHRNMGIADEMQDFTRTAWYVFLETVNLPGRQIFCMGTGGPKGTLWHELWEMSDQKEWNGKKWIPTNKNAEPGYSGYHASQVWSPFESKEKYEFKRRTYPRSLFLSEVECTFYDAAGDKPAPYELTKQLIIAAPSEIRELMNSVVSTSIGIDWGNESTYVVVGLLNNGNVAILRTGAWADPNDSIKATDNKTDIESGLRANERRIRAHLRASRDLIDTEKPNYVMCDAGYSKKIPETLMRDYPKKVWTVTTGKKNTLKPTWKSDYATKEFRCSIDHSTMCEELESRVSSQTMHIIDIDNSNSIERYLFELNKADVEAKETAESIRRVYSITKAHSYAATAYALIPFTGRNAKAKKKMYPSGF